MNSMDIKFTTLQMRTDKFGWAGIQYSNKEKQAILYTEDSGLTWDIVNPLNTIILSIYPIDSKSCWVYGLTKVNHKLVPAIFYTTDRGNKWNELILPIKEEWEATVDVQVHLHATNTDSIWIILSKNSKPNKFEHNLYYTKNRRENWKITRGIKIVGGITGLTFINSLIGFITTQKSYNNSTTYKTVDGGEIWTPIENITFYPNINSGVITPYKPIYKNHLLVIPIKISNNSNVFYMNCSFDKGKTWIISNQILNTGHAAVSFFNSQFGWVIDGETGKTYRIKKKGLEWEMVSINPFLKNVFCLHFFNPHNGWVCNKKEIFNTTDGGITWKRVPYKINNFDKI
ncbi:MULTISPECIES: VPS10 domain-containing protein [Bacillus cereus group]|uniref:VPS10 domain-containing protein n=1 Tax=Bacillus cereus group TaxID=86661 RepID=UPI002EC16BB6|nr:hypothetical protein [Bacillus thuringiensis]